MTEVILNATRYKVSARGALAVKWSEYQQDWIKCSMTNAEVQRAISRKRSFVPWWRAQTPSRRFTFATQTGTTPAAIERMIENNSEILRELEDVLNAKGQYARKGAIDPRAGASVC